MWLPEAWEQYKAAREALANTTGSTEVIFSAQSSGCKKSESDKQVLLESIAKGTTDSGVDCFGLAWWVWFGSSSSSINFIETQVVMHI